MINYDNSKLRSVSIFLSSLLCGILAFFTPNWHKPLLAYGALTPNQTYVFSAIQKACSNSPSDSQLSTVSCDLLSGISSGSLSTDVLTQITTEQTGSQSTNALIMNNGRVSRLGSRIASFRPGGFNGVVRLSQADSLNMAAAGDQSGIFEKLGFFINGNGGFGDRTTTINEIGYNRDQQGTTAGVDYRFNDNFLMGVAFSYDHANNDFYQSLGRMQSDSYSGAIYGSFTMDNFFVDGFFSGSALDYTGTRHIQYTGVNTNASSNNGGTEYNVSLTGGYNFNIKGLTLTPQVRFDYITTQVDAVDETGGSGWALHVDKQNFDSIKSSLGTQASYAISFPWGVLLPTVRLDWVHEYANDARVMTAYFNQDPSKTRFNIVTDNPDRDFINLGAGVSAQFAHGISTFVNYETIQAHRYIGNHAFTAGVRLAF